VNLSERCFRRRDVFCEGFRYKSFKVFLTRCPDIGVPSIESRTPDGRAAKSAASSGLRGWLRPWCRGRPQVVHGERVTGGRYAVAARAVADRCFRASCNRAALIATESSGAPSLFVLEHEQLYGEVRVLMAGVHERLDVSAGQLLDLVDESHLHAVLPALPGLANLVPLACLPRCSRRPRRRRPARAAGRCDTSAAPCRSAPCRDPRSRWRCPGVGCQRPVQRTRASPRCLQDEG
jgi:hypothetical protein